MSSGMGGGRVIRGRPAVRLALVVGVLSASGGATSGQAQEIRAVGGVVGGNSARQLWSNGAGETGSRTGLTLGAFVEVAAPPSWLGVMAEATYSQRGARLDESFTGSVPAEVRSDYLTGLLAPTLRWFPNPMGLTVGAGLAFEYLITTNAARELEIIYGNPTPMALSGVLLAGGEYLHRERWWFRMEARWFEGLRQAYTGTVTDVRIRAFEAVLKVGTRPASDRPPR
jgi:hypothetical protein